MSSDDFKKSKIEYKIQKMMNTQKESSLPIAENGRFSLTAFPNPLRFSLSPRQTSFALF